MSPILSTKTVPPQASSKSPFWSFWASGTEPVSSPKRMPSRSVSSRPVQVTLRNGLPAREELAWMAFATRSFPVPFSPRMRTARSSRLAILSISPLTTSIPLDRPTRPGAPARALRGPPRLRSGRAGLTVIATPCMPQVVATGSDAPSFRAATA